MRFTLWMIVLCGLATPGCGSEDYKYKEENPDPPEVVYANEVRMHLNGMKESVKAEGAKAIDFDGYFEGMEGYGEKPPVGQNGETYKKIDAGVKELQEMVLSGKSKADVTKKIDELLALTEGLPQSKASAPSS
jgi:hypothetical protein